VDFSEYMNFDTIEDRDALYFILMHFIFVIFSVGIWSVKQMAVEFYLNPSLNSVHESRQLCLMSQWVRGTPVKSSMLLKFDYQEVFLVVHGIRIQPRISFLILDNV